MKIIIDGSELGMILMLFGAMMVLCGVGYLFNKWIIYPFRYYALKQKRYMFEHIPSYGAIPTRYGWFKTDKEARNAHKGWADIIFQVYPKERQINTHEPKTEA
jgi:hypothetical protein